MIVAAAWLALTVPLLTLGYGSDVDAWLVGERALQIWNTHTYARSRSTGFPLYELSVTPLVHVGGWLASNAFALAAGLVLMLLLFRMAQRGALRYPAATIATFMFLPMVVKSATSTMDYAPGLALLVGAYVAWEMGRPFWCAVLIGVACGVRPSNILFVVPAAAGGMVQATRPRAAVLMMVGTTLLVGAIAFSPSLALGAFGIAHTVPTLKGAQNAFRLFGVAQTPVLAALMLTALWKARHELTPRDQRPFLTFHIVNLIVWAGAFAMLPDEPEYLLPAVISVILVLDRYATRRSMLATLATLLSYHVATIEVLGSRGGLRRTAVAVQPGLTIRDVNDRRFKMWLRDAAAHWHGNQPTLFMEQMLPPIVGRDGWRYLPDLDIYRQVDGTLAVSQRITDVRALQAIHAQRYRVVVWRAHEWEFQLPATIAAHPLVEFVDDPGDLFGLPIRGRPLD